MKTYFAKLAIALPIVLPAAFASAEEKLTCKLADSGQQIEFALHDEGQAGATLGLQRFSGSYQKMDIGGQTRLTGSKTLDLEVFYSLPDDSKPHSIVARLVLSSPDFKIGFGEIYIKDLLGHTQTESGARCSVEENFGGCPDPLPLSAQCRELRCGSTCSWQDASGSHHTCTNYGC